MGNVTTHTWYSKWWQNLFPVRLNKTELLVGGADGKAKLFRQATKAAPAGGGNPNQIREFKEQIGRIFSVDFNPKGNLGFSGSSLDGKGEVRCFEIDTVNNYGPNYLIVPLSMQFAVYQTERLLQLLDMTEKSDYFQLLREVNRELSIAPLQKDHIRGSKITLNKDFEPLNCSGRNHSENLRVIGLSIQPQSSPYISFGLCKILVTADLGNGRESDVTRMVEWSIPKKIGNIDNRGLFTPFRDGKAEIKATLGDHTASIEVSITGTNKPYQPDYISEVNPIISKLGCNAGTCHGAKDGKNGFKLSLVDMMPLRHPWLY